MDLLAACRASLAGAAGPWRCCGAAAASAKVSSDVEWVDAAVAAKPAGASDEGVRAEDTTAETATDLPEDEDSSCPRSASSSEGLGEGAGAETSGGAAAPVAAAAEEDSEASREAAPEEADPPPPQQQPEVGAPEGRPNFAGDWLLQACEGDADTFLSDMRQPWYLKTAAKGFRYGVGRVAVQCHQDGDAMSFRKRLMDPRKGEAFAQFTVGEGSVTFSSDIGLATATPRWEGQALRCDAVLEGVNLPITLLLYYNDAGNYVEEMISCKGTVLKYVFRRQA